MQGAGLQFFAMAESAKSRWDTFVAQLSQAHLRAQIRQRQADQHSSPPGAAMRAGGGGQVIGRSAPRDFAADELIEL